MEKMRLPFYRQWFVIWRCPLWQVWLYTQALILYCPCFCCHSFCLWHKCSMLSFWVEANLCSFFYVYYVYMYCRWRSSYPEGSVAIPLTSLIPPYFCACPNTGNGFPTLCVVVSLFCVQWVKVRGDIGGIIYHYCLSFLFLIGSFSSNYELHKWFFF
jgi:hypothetical protein